MYVLKHILRRASRCFGRRALLLRYFWPSFCVRTCSIALAFNKIEFPALQLPFGALREAPAGVSGAILG